MQTEQPGENWKAIAGYEGYYEVSDTGKIRSVDRVVINRGFPQRLKGVTLRHNLNQNGYPYVIICKNGKTKCQCIHKAVAAAFVDNPDGRRVINHKDGNKQNNNASNLEWTTSLENNLHALRTGLRVPTRGEKQGKSVLKEHQVYEIRRRADSGESVKKLAQEFGVKEAAVSAVKHRRTWRHLPERPDVTECSETPE